MKEIYSQDEVIQELNKQFIVKQIIIEIITADIAEFTEKLMNTDYKKVIEFYKVLKGGK